LILKRILLPVLLRQQQPGIFECIHQSLRCRRLILGLVAIHLNICPTLVQNTTFKKIYIYFSGLLDFQL
jgi:hypothetical protein